MPIDQINAPYARTDFESFLRDVRFDLTARCMSPGQLPFEKEFEKDTTFIIEAVLHHLRRSLNDILMNEHWLASILEQYRELLCRTGLTWEELNLINWNDDKVREILRESVVIERLKK